MGSNDFVRRVFTKVFTEDIDRLRTMEDMWKSRKPPEPLHFDELAEEAVSIDAEVSRQDQRSWSLIENFVVFSDRCAM